MADSKPIDYASFLYAYALGCLDKDDLLPLLEYFESGKDYPWQELGEFQNLASLLPSFLNIEEPPPLLKDRVARTLYRLRESKPPVKSPSVIIPPPATHSSKTKTSLKEKMRISSVEPPQAPKTFSPPESDDIVAPPDFKASSPFSQRAGVGARPQQDTQIRSRAQQPTLDRQALSSEQERSDILIPQDDAEARFRDSAPEEFIINQNYEDHAPETTEGLHLHFSEAPAESPAIPETPKQEPPASSDEAPQFEFNMTDDKPVPAVSDPAKLEDIRKQVVADVEKESVVEGQANDDNQRVAPPLILYIMPIIIILGLVAVYYMLNTKIKNVQNSSAVPGQYVAKEEFDKFKENAAPRWSAEVLSLLLRKDTKSILLNGSGKFAGSYGKMILDGKTGEGFLALGFLPIPPQDTRYHFWLLEGKSATHIDFKEIPVFSQESVTYTPTAKIPPLKGKKEVFLLTIEKSGSAPEQPSQQRCLEGVVQ